MDFLKRLFRRQPKVHKVDISRRFELIGRVGQGSMSKVWRANDQMTGKHVALKVLDKAKLARLNARFSSMGIKRPTEGEIAIVLRHTNIVRTSEHGMTTEDEPFLIMEFIEGMGLSFLVDVQNPRMKELRLWFCVQLGEAIAYLHQNDWIHRDICPRNVIVGDDNTLKLIDFGLMVPNMDEFKQPGNRTGTAAYMAPELIKRQRTDQRIDIFSYAVTCFEMHCKALPWQASPLDTIENILQHINKPPRDIRQFCPGIDEELAAIIMRGLERNPDERWQTMREMVTAMRAVALRLEQIPEE